MLYASSTTPLSFICKFWNGPETKGIFYSLLVFYRSLLFNFNWLFAFHLWAQTILWMTDSCGCQLAFSILIFKMSYSISFMKPSKLFVFTWSYSTVLTCSRHEMFVPGTEISLIWKKEIEILGDCIHRNSLLYVLSLYLSTDKECLVHCEWDETFSQSYAAWKLVLHTFLINAAGSH